MNRFAAVLSLFSALAFAQAPGASGPVGRGPQAPLAIPNPHYVTLQMEVEVNRSAADAWKRVGKWCDVGEWLRIANCTLLSGADGEVGAVRSVGNEVIVGKTEFSYTYTQPVREGRPYNMYHGTLEARPVTATTCRLIYTLLWDNSMIAEDARDADINNRRTSFTNALNNMKILVEGGTLPPAPARGGRGGSGRGANR